MARKSKEPTPHLRIRIEPETLARLEKSRRARGRTLTGEIVDRVERSFRKEDDADLAVDVFRGAFGGATGDLFRAFATAIWLIEKRTGKKWNEDRDTAFQINVAMRTVLRAFVFPLEAKVAYLDFKHEDSLLADHGIKSSFKHEPGMVAALETLQKMGMAPPDAEIAEAGKKYVAKQKSKDEGEGQ